MLSILGSLISVIPGVTTLLTTVSEKAFDARVKLTQAKTGADRDVAIEIVRAATKEEELSTTRLQVAAGSKILLFLIVGFALPWIFYEWRVVFYDNVWLGGAGDTPAIRGQVGEWGGVIIASLFGSATAVTLGSMWFNRRQQ